MTNNSTPRVSIRRTDANAGLDWRHHDSTVLETYAVCYGDAVVGTIEEGRGAASFVLGGYRLTIGNYSRSFVTLDLAKAAARKYVAEQRAKG